MESGLQWPKKGQKVSDKLQLMGSAGETLAERTQRSVCLQAAVSAEADGFEMAC